MLGNVPFLLGLAVALGIGFLYFRDLGDVSQMLLRVKRENMLRFIRNEYRLIAIGLGALALATALHFGLGGGPRWAWWTAVFLCALLYGFPYVWVHVGLRNQKDSARYYSIEEAKEYVSPSSQVIVNENNGVARAHPQTHLMRPHLAGNDDGLDGENVVMTYCAMANLGLGYTPEVEGESVELEVLAQHGNNLVLRDNRTGEPIQQIYGFREADVAPKGETEGAACPLRPRLAMKPWPTFRMTFRGFQKAYPKGTVFLNKPPSNPILYLFDMALEIIFSSSIDRQHRENKPVMDNMTRYDDRLPNKTYVWGVSLGDDAVCWTDDFVVEQGNIVNAEVGGRRVVIAWHPRYESLGVWYNDTGAPVTEIDFFGDTPDGKLERVENLRPGLFWHVWAEFFPHTDINRVGAFNTQKAA
jgi:hypothetical protein